MKLLLLLAICAFPSLANGTSVRLLSEAEMVAHAGMVVRGTVLRVAPRRHASGLIVTDVTLRVERLLKAMQSVAELTFVQLGGNLDGTTLAVPGASQYREGEEVVVFLEAGGEGLVEIGVGTSKFRVRRMDGRITVERELGSVNLVRYDGGRGVPVVPRQPSLPELLAVFETRISQLVRR